MIELSCGTVPFTLDEGTRKYLLIETPKGDIGLPKGHIEEGESEEECALRETYEETSVHVTIIEGFRYRVGYKLPWGRYKKVVYFLAEFYDQTPRRNGDFENFKYHILPYEEAVSAVTYENTREVLRAAEEYLRQRD